MTGIFLLCVVVTWFLVAVAIASRVGSGIPDRWRWLFRTAVFCVLLVLPIADEIIGGFQFRALCEKNASQFRMGVSNPEGRTTKVTINPSNLYLSGTAIPIRHSHFEFHDTSTNELVVAFDEYVAKGGLFIRSLGISENNSPLTIGLPACTPEQVLGESVHRTFKFSVSN